MDEQMRTKLIQIRERFVAEGFVILGVFGSRARGDHRPDSDLDILYRLEERFYREHSSWGGVIRIEEIREQLRATMGLPIDLADMDALRSSARDAILPETVYVA